MEHPINHAVTITSRSGGPNEPAVVQLPPTVVQLDELFDPIYKRLHSLGRSETLLVAFARRMDAQSDPNEFLQVVEMEPAYEIRPYARPRQSMYRGL